MEKYYKSKDGNTFLSEWTEEVDSTIFDEITKEEFDEYQRQLYPEPTQEEIEKQQISEQIEQLKAELSETDYVALKLSEALAEGTQDEILDEYADVLARRKELRAQINSLQEQLNNN